MTTVTEPIAYRVEDAATVTSLSVSHIRRAIAAGALTCHYIGGRQVILRDDLVRWIESAPTERAS